MKTRRFRSERTAAVDEEEQLDSALRKFGYVSGQACQCPIQQDAKTRPSVLVGLVGRRQP